MLFFLKSTSISNYIHFYDSDSLLTTLTTLFGKITLKAFLRDYSDYAYLHKKIVSSMIMLTAMIFKTTWKIVLSLSSLITRSSIPDEK